MTTKTGSASVPQQSSAGYAAVLTATGAPPLVLWSLIGRFAFAGSNLALLTCLEAVSGSFGFAGAMMAVSLVGTAAAGMAQGRLIDRLGPSRPLLALSVAHCLASLLLILLVIRLREHGVPHAVLAAAVLAQSTTQPMLIVASRAMWPRLLPAGPFRDTAYSYETVSTEACYLVAPALSATLATSLWPETSLVCTVVLVVAAAVGFALAPLVRAHRGPQVQADQAAGEAVARRLLLKYRGMPPLLGASLGFGVGVGFVTVTTTAAAEELGQAHLTGALLAVWSVSSVLGGLLYNKRPWPRPLGVRLPLLAAAFSLLLLPALIGGIYGLVAALVLTGATLAPQLTAQTALLDHLVPVPRITEAYGWSTTLVAVGNAAGQASSGALTEQYGYQMSFLVCACTVLALAAATGSRWRRMAEGRPPAHH